MSYSSNKICTNPIYINALTKLLSYCFVYNIEVSSIENFMGGFKVTFAGFPNCDAICHDYSMGHEAGHWETMGFAWDYDDVTELTVSELINLLYIYS